MLVGLVALMAAAAEARWAWMPAAAPVPSGGQTRGAARHAGPWLEDKGEQTEDTGDQASRSTDLMEKIMGKLSSYSDTMWSPPWLEKVQTKAKAELESAVLDAELQLQRAKLESARACARIEEFEAQTASTAAQLARTEERLESRERELEESAAQLARTEERLESKERELEESCRNARDRVASLDDALEGAQDKLAKVQRELDQQRKSFGEERREFLDASASQSARIAVAMKEAAEVMERDAVNTQRDAALMRVAELKAALAEAQLPKRVRMQRFLSRLRERWRRK